MAVSGSVLEREVLSTRPCRLPGPRALGIYGSFFAFCILKSLSHTSMTLGIYGIFFRIYPKPQGKTAGFSLKIQIFGQQCRNLPFYAQNFPFFWYWRKKHRFIPKKSIYTLYRYVQNELSSLAACLPLNPSPGSGRQLPQSSLETARSCTQYPAGIPVKDGFSML